MRHRRGLDLWEPVGPNSFQFLWIAALWNDDICREWTVHQTCDIFRESLGCWTRECGIVPNVPDIAHVIIIVGIKLGAGNDFHCKDIPGNHRRAGIIQVEVQVLTMLTSVELASHSWCGQGIPQVSTAQEKNLPWIKFYSSWKEWINFIWLILHSTLYRHYCLLLEKQSYQVPPKHCGLECSRMDRRMGGIPAAPCAWLTTAFSNTMRIKKKGLKLLSQINYIKNNFKLFIYRKLFSLTWRTALPDSQVHVDCTAGPTDFWKWKKSRNDQINGCTKSHFTRRKNII